MMKDQSFKTYILNQLEPLGLVRIRAMFGGVGLYHKDIFSACSIPAVRFISRPIQIAFPYTWHTP